MTLSEMRETVKENLKLTDDTRDLDISDVIFNVCDYCNLNQNELPELLEPYIRKKVKGIINYETVKGTGYQQDIASIKEGDGSVTYVTGGSNSREGIYGLTDADKTALRRFRRLRGYV
ncbi:MAG: DNA-packaging protein [Clostridium fessum]|jgi:hypothetical protein